MHDSRMSSFDDARGPFLEIDDPEFISTITPKEASMRRFVWDCDAVLCGVVSADKSAGDVAIMRDVAWFTWLELEDCGPNVEPVHYVGFWTIEPRTDSCEPHTEYWWPSRRA